MSGKDGKGSWGSLDLGPVLSLHPSAIFIWMGGRLAGALVSGITALTIDLTYSKEFHACH